jgi:hypothetical protein
VRACCAAQVANPLGYAKGEQKYECCYYSILNLSARLRHSMGAIQLLELTNSKAFKAYGAARILSGVTKDGTMVNEPNFAADMRALAEGSKVDLPKEGGGTRSVTLQVFVLGLSADFPAAGALLPFFESVSAHRWCRECDADSEAGDCKKPFVFTAGNVLYMGSKKQNRGDNASPPRIREQGMLRARIKELRAQSPTLSATALSAKMAKVRSLTPLSTLKSRPHNSDGMLTTRPLCKSTYRKVSTSSSTPSTRTTSHM